MGFESLPLLWGEFGIEIPDKSQPQGKGDDNLQEFGPKRFQLTARGCFLRWEILTMA